MRNQTLKVLLSRNFIICFISFFLIWISFDFFILFPLFILRNGGDSIDVGIQTAIFFFPAVFIRPIAGWLTDSKGRLKVLWFGSVLMTITGFAFLALHGTYEAMKWAMAVILFLRGVSFAAFYTAFFTYVVDLSQPENRARIVGLFGVSGLIGHGAAPRVAEIVLGSYGFTGYFLCSGALSLAGLLISFALKEVERKRHATTQTGLQTIFRAFWNRVNVVILPAGFVFGFVIASFNTFGAPYFENSGRVSVGNFFLIYGLTAGLVRIFLGGVADKFQRWKLAAVFFVVQGAAMMVITVEPLDYWYFPAAILAGLAHGILFPLLTAMAIDAHEEKVRGVVTSIFTAAIELGFSLGAYLLGVVVAWVSYAAMFDSAGLLAILFAGYVLVCYTILRNRWPVSTVSSSAIEV